MSCSASNVFQGLRIRFTRAHYARSKTRVRIRFQFGAWLSLVERTVRDREVGGSNPLAPTISERRNGCDGSRFCFVFTRKIKAHDRRITGAKIVNAILARLLYVAKN